LTYLRRQLFIIFLFLTRILNPSHQFSAIFVSAFPPKHFGPLPHNSMKTRRNSIHQSIFSAIMTEST